MINWITLVPLLSFVSYLIILLSNFENWMKTRQGRLFAIYLFLLSVYAFSSWLMHRGLNPSPLFWFKIEMAALFFFSPLIIHFAIEFPSPKDRLRKWIIFWYLTPIMLEILLFTNRIIKNVEYLPDRGGEVRIEFHPVVIVLWIYMAMTLLITLVIYLRTYFQKNTLNRHLVFFPFLGSLILFSGGFLNLSPTLRAYPVELIGYFMYSLLVAYGILRYQFLVPGAIFRKSSVYLVIAVAFNTLFIFILYNILPLVEEMPGWQLWLLFSPLAFFAALFATPLRQKFQNLLDKVFFGEQYSYRLTIENFSKEAASNLNFKELTKSLVAMLNKVFNCPVALFMVEKEEESLHLVEVAGYTKKQPEHSFVLTKSPLIENLIKAGKPFIGSNLKVMAGPAEIMASDLKWLDTVESEMLSPLIFKDKLSGIIVLGKKKGLYPYSDEDISLLSALSSQIAIALDNARLYLESQEAYKDLREAQEHLMHSERMRLLGEVSSGVAHDLNNLLAVISARSEMNLALIEQPQAYRNTELILKAAEDSAKVVKRLHEFVKKPKDIFQDKLDVNKLVMAMLPMVEHRRSELEQVRGVFFEIDYKLQARSEIMGNSSELRQAMVNILFNAFDAMPQGGLIEIQSQDRDDWVVISLHDSGMGMTQEVKEKIFQPFFTTKGEKGSGLGLSIALSIVNKHGGKLAFDSGVGKGTTFYLTFPSASRVTKRGEIKELATNGNSKKILVIEDNKELGESITFFLNQAGYLASLATEGTEGLAKFQQDTYNMVVTDWGLSPMTGGDVALSIRAMNSNVPIMVITGWELNLSPTTLRDMGIIDVIIKPFAREEFLGRIARFIKSS